MNSGANTLQKGFFLTAWLVFAIFAAFWVMMIMMQSPNVAGVENNIVYFIQRILNGSSPYSNPEQAPYAIAQYNPLYYYAVAAPAKLAGLTADDVRSLFILNRAISLVFLLLACTAIYFTGKKIYQFSQKKATVLFAMVFVFMEISSFARPDSLACAAYCWSLFFFLSALKNKKNSSIIASSLLAAIAVYSKQSALTVAVFSMIGLFWLKEYKSLGWYLVYFLLWILVGLAMIMTCFGLPVFFQNVVKGIDNGINLPVYFDYIVQDFLGKYGLLWMIVMVPVLILLRKEASNEKKVLVVFISAQFIASCLSALKYGSSSNYFTEWWILVMLGAACCWSFFREISSTINKGLLSLCLIVILLLRASTLIQPVYKAISPVYKMQRAQVLATETQVVAYIKNLPGSDSLKLFNNIFSPDSYLNNFLFRQAIVPQNDVVTLGTYDRNVFNYSHLRREIKDGSIRFMVLKGDTINGFLKIATTDYKVKQQIGDYTILEHKNFNE